MNNENKTPQWLVNIQENSWNVELFISIGFVYVLFKLPQLTDNVAENIIANYGVFSNYGYLRFIIHLALFVLPIGFITHLVFRGIWIGLVGFSYVFPGGIRTEKLDYTERYKHIISKSKDPINIIIALEKTCSMIYTFTFLFFFILLAVFNYLLISGLILEGINFFSDSNQIFVIFRVFFLFIGLLYAFDFFTAGLIKKNKLTGDLFYPIYRAVSFITFSKLYRTQYYTLITEYNKLRVTLTLFVVLIGYIFISIVTNRVKTDSRELYSNTFHSHYLIISEHVYENSLPDNKLFSNAFIQSDI
jgi:hypothetical protein